MDEIEVTARFLPGKGVIPLRFKWQEKVYKIDSVGRRWNATDGNHILVMDMESQVFHLVYNSDQMTWHLFQSGESSILNA